MSDHTIATHHPFRRTKRPLLMAPLAGTLFFVGPKWLTPLLDPSDISDRLELEQAVDRGFTHFWKNDGERSALREAIRFWSTYHLLKLLFAALIVAVAVSLSARLFDRAKGAGSQTMASLWSVATAFAGATGAFFSLLVLANLQGLVAPIASLLPTLVASPDPESARVVNDAQRLLPVSDAARSTRPLHVLIHDFTRFHVVLAIGAAVLAVGLLLTSLAAWRRARRTMTSERRIRSMYRWLAASSGTAALALGLLAVVNSATAAAPLKPLAALLAGGS